MSYEAISYTRVSPLTESTERDTLIHAIGQAILGDENYVDRDWVGIALVFRLDRRKSVFGYVYDADGEWEAEIPSSFDIVDQVTALRTAMDEPGREPWKTCLLQIKRPGPRIAFDFDYVNGERWNLGPITLNEAVEALRPR